MISLLFPSSLDSQQQQVQLGDDVRGYAGRGRVDGGLTAQGSSGCPSLLLREYQSWTRDPRNLSPSC
jgi:hypothetical protein